MNPTTLQPLVASLATFGDRPAVGYRGAYGVRWWSYARLLDEAHQVAMRLRDRGIQSGERILLWAPNSPEWVAVLLGCLLRGIVVVPIDEGASPAYARRIAREVGAALALHGLEQDVAGLGLEAEQIVNKRPPRSAESRQDLVAEVQPGDPAVIIFTSGTTIQPKGVVLTHGNLAAQVAAFRSWKKVLRLAQFRLLVLAPLSHSQGLLLGACVPLAIGLSTLFTRSTEPSHLIRTIRDNRVTLLSTVPRVLSMLANSLRHWPGERRDRTLEARLLRTRSRALRNVILERDVHRRLGEQFRVLFVGGAALSASDERFWRDAGCLLVQGYGLTETAAIVSVNDPFRGRFGSIGRPLSHETVQLADDGEILVRGANVADGYFKKGPTDSDVFSGGWLHTGDLARKDRQGRLYFLGRKKEVIVTSEGFNVHPEDIEAVVKSVAGVRDAIAVGIDRSGSTELHAVLLLRNGVQPEQVIQEANGQLETHQVIRNWSVYPDADFPRTSLMKVRREQVAARLRRSGETAAGRVPPLQEILAIGDRRLRLQLLADHLVQTADGLGSSPVTRLSDFGFGSLDLVELLTLVESRLGVPLDHASLPAGLTVPELVSLARSWGDAAPERRSSAAPAAFSINPIGSALRRVVQPGIIGLWSWFAGATPAVEKLAAMPTGTPVIIAAAPHRHWLDAFVLYRALPRRLRTKIAVVTNFDFDERFGAAAAPAGKRLLAGAAYYVALPLTFAFVILPQRTATRDGLFQLGRLLDLGYNPITFPKGLFTGDRDTDRHDPGVAMIALETQTPILPVWIEHNDSLRVFPQGRRRRPTVRFGDLIPITPTLARDQLVRQVETAFRKLAP